MTIHRSPGCPEWTFGCPNNDDQVEVSVIMRALDPEVMDAMWAAAEPLLPVGGGDHPLGCHNPRIADLWVPIIRSWALTRGFALHPGTRNRYEIRYTRTQHRPASRHVNDHGRVSGTHVCPEGK